MGITTEYEQFNACPLSALVMSSLESAENKEYEPPDMLEGIHEIFRD